MADFELVVEDLFHIAGQGTVVSGTVSSGKARVGEKLAVCSAEASVRVRLIGVERLGSGEIVRAARAGDRVGLLLDGFDPEAVPDGVRRTETGWELVALTIRARA